MTRRLFPLVTFGLALASAPAGAAWDLPMTPDAELHRDGVARLVQLASLPSGVRAARWRSDVHEALGIETRSDPTPQDALEGLRRAFQDWGLSYRNGPAPFRGQPAGVATNLPSLDVVLAARGGDCRQLSQLASATLAELGIETVLIVTRDHVVPAIVLPREERGREAGQNDGFEASRMLRPFEATLLGTDRPLEEVEAEGRIFLSRALRSPEAVIVDMEGRILWRSARPGYRYGLPGAVICRDGSLFDPSDGRE